MLAEAEKRRFKEPLDEAMLFDRLSSLRGFDRAVFRFGRLLAATGGVALKSPSKGKTMTATEIAYEYLKRIGAKDFETGKSAEQVAKATGYSRISMSNALNELAKKGVIRAEQRGRHIRYYLVAPP